MTGSCFHPHTDYSPTIEARVCLDCQTVLPAKRNKFNAKRTTVDGVTFDSAAEASRYEVLRAQQLSGEIGQLDLQPEYVLHAPDGTRIGSYRADFAYVDYRTGQQVIEDVKGVRTALYSWKKRHAEAEYRIRIVEVQA